MRKCCIPYIPCRSLLLSTTVLNDYLCPEQLFNRKAHAVQVTARLQDCFFDLSILFALKQSLKTLGIHVGGSCSSNQLHKGNTLYIENHMQ